MEQLFDVLRRVTSTLRAAGVEHRVIGGVAIFLHVSERDALAARATRDIDLAVNRHDLGRIAEAVRPHGFVFGHAAGLDMLTDVSQPGARSAVHLVMAGEKVQPSDLVAIPGLTQGVETAEGIPLAPVADLVRMKLTGFRFKDKAHLKDMQGVGLITPEVEASLPEELRARLAEVLAGE